MQTCERLVRRGGFFQLLYESAQPSLFWFSNDEKFHTDTLSPTPTDSGILNFERHRLSREMQEQRHLHSGKRGDQAFDTATLCRKVADGAFVPKLVTLNQDARHGDMETAVLASDHSGRLSCDYLRRRQAIVGDIEPAALVPVLPSLRILSQTHTASSNAQLPSEP